MQLPKDPLRRFQEVFEALNAERGWFSDVSVLRFAAIGALTCEGNPTAVAQAIRANAEQLKERSGWFGELTGELRFIVASRLLQTGDRPDDFMAEVERVRTMFRAAGMSRGGIYEIMSILILRGMQKEPITDPVIGRMQALYEEMKKHHWWLTGVADFPACAILVGQPGSPESIGLAIEDIYQALYTAGCRRGDPLQAAANLLFLAHEKPSVIAGRFHALIEAFRGNGQRIWQSEYDEVAILAMLNMPAADVVARTCQIAEELREWRPRPDRALAFNLASSIAFIELAQAGESAQGVTAAKALVDMQAIINAQQAAMMAASMAAITASVAATNAASG